MLNTIGDASLQGLFRSLLNKQKRGKVVVPRPLYANVKVRNPNLDFHWLKHPHWYKVITLWHPHNPLCMLAFNISLGDLMDNDKISTVCMLSCNPLPMNLRNFPSATGQLRYADALPANSTLEVKGATRVILQATPNSLSRKGNCAMY